MENESETRPVSTIRESTCHLLSRKKEIADGCGEIIHRLPSEDGQLLADGAEKPEIVVDCDERHGVEGAGRLYCFVDREDVQDVCAHVAGDAYFCRGGAPFRVIDFEKVEKGVSGVGVMPAEWLQAELAVHEDDCVSCFQEVLCRSCPSGSWEL